MDKIASSYSKIKYNVAINMNKLNNELKIQKDEHGWSRLKS